MGQVSSEMAERLLNTLGQSADLLSRSSAPVDTDGARPVPPLLTKKVEDVEYIVKHGSPLSLSDIVSMSSSLVLGAWVLINIEYYAQPAFIDAAKNLTTAGIDDRKFLASSRCRILAWSSY